MIKNKEKIFVGMSGGVDSSVSALLLKKAGHDVTGVFIKAWHPDFIPCNWRGEMHDAMRVCAKLKIPFLLCDLEDAYKKNVVDYLINEYKLGRTPNPDVFCNKTIKFGEFLRWSLARGADKIATGHYAQKKPLSSLPDDYGLFCAKDENKDQTYFLWTLTREQINRAEFPIGHLNKEEVRMIAKKHGLHTSEKKDSQGLCFIGQVNMKDFLRRFIVPTPGKIVNEQGIEVGSHDGVELYTLGERHGLNISQDENDTKPYYVTRKDLDDNRLIVSNSPSGTTEKSSGLKSQPEFKLEAVNFIPDRCAYVHQMEQGVNIQIRIRHRGNLIRSIIKREKDTFNITTKEKDLKIAPGQSVVFYQDERCLGGGILNSKIA